MLKYASTPQLHYGNNEQSGLRIRVPAGTQPIQTANEHTFKNLHSGAVSWRMDGTLVNPVA